MGIPFTKGMGFLFTATMGKLFTMTLGIQLTVSSSFLPGLSYYAWTDLRRGEKGGIKSR